MGPGVWGEPRPEKVLQLTPCGPQVLLHRATESLLLPLHGALDPSRGSLGRGQEAPPGPPSLCTGLPVVVLPRHEHPGGWSPLPHCHSSSLGKGALNLASGGGSLRVCELVTLK